MSQKSNPQTLADKYKVGGEFHQKLKETCGEAPIVEIDSQKRKPIKSRRLLFKIVSLVGILFVLFLAALKNPSSTQGKAQIKSYLVERLKDYSSTIIAADKSSGDWSKGLGSLLINTFAPSLIDSMVDIQTSNFIFFSTFKAQIEENRIPKNLLSGVILFGEIMPLSTDLDKDKLRESGFDI